MFPFWQKKKPAPTPRWRRPDEGFRSNADQVAWARETFGTLQGQRLEAFLWSGLPTRSFYPGDTITGDQALLEYGRWLGYMACLSRLQEATQPLPIPSADIPADYDQTPPDKQDAE